MLTRTLLAAVCAMAVGPCPAFAQRPDDAIAARDALIVIVWEQPDLSGKYIVESDGTFTFPLVGRVTAGGLQLRELQEQLTKRLADGLVKDPQLSIELERHRGPMAHVIGEVRQPGSFDLTRDMTLIEVLARAGSTTERAGAVAVITRPHADRQPAAQAGPARAAASEVIRVNLKALQNGAGELNIPLRDGDTVFVPRAESIYVTGEVRNPGSYVVQDQITVLQAIALAGGLTERGSNKRVRVIREINGRKQQVKVKLDQVLVPGDTIVVGERLF